MGLGAAFGIALKTNAYVILTDHPREFEVTIIGEKEEDPQLAELCVLSVLKRYRL